MNWISGGYRPNTLKFRAVRYHGDHDFIGHQETDSDDVVDAGTSVSNADREWAW
ncbi:hypothetical protein [Saccharomonospora iraqiensis]|uniref:hypothetical protein n=1 Tax=Saccharomonospora iraqiensis TaxID=52698 RepID=UPI0012F7D8F4|nr:hypothetical protein [Saccharomonospora iraqiensis]